MAMQNQYMNQQFSVRNVVIENLSTKNIMARVSFQKSAMTRSNLESYNKVAKEKVVSGGVGVSGYAKIEAKAEAKLGIDRGDDNFTGAKAEAGASAEIGGGINVNASKSKGRLQETHDKQQYEMAVSAFEEEGWHMIKYGADKQFAVQGQLIYMSVMDPEDNKILIHNWTSTDNNFIYDGEDFDTKARWEKANKGGRKRMERHRDTKAKEAAAALKQAAKEDEKRRKEEAKAAKKLAKSRKNSSKQSSVEVVYTQPSDQPPPNTSGPVEPLQTDGTAQQLQNAMDDKTGDDGCTCCEMSGENECCEKYGKFIGGFVAAIVCLIVLIVVIVVVTGKEDTAKDLAN
mmetsp:Transcript_42036/g.37262  ORF Transcript_42036/g.37262 Transcript_42036/m.37262 type:complete len:344 (+) Transcript_42036:152-1183(+)